MMRFQSLSLSERRRFLGTTVGLGLGALGSAWLAAPAHAQVKVDISGIAANRFNLAMGSFAGDTGGVRITDVIGQDLARTGRFNFNSVTLAADANLNITDFSPAGSADAALVGHVTMQGTGGYKVGFRLYDVARKTAMGGLIFDASDAELRTTAHRIADYVFSKLTGIPGAANTHIAYITGGGSRHSLIVSDVDGANPQEALRSNAPLISVCWSPRGDRLAYTSFELGFPTVFVHNLQTGERKRLINRQCSSPSFAPDGNSLLLSLVNRGATSIFRSNLDGSGLSQVVSSNGIDTRGVFSPDGRLIYFVSNRGGAPQIYRQSVDGGSADRVTFGANQALAPALSADGKFLAFIAQVGGGYRLTLQDLASNTTTALGPGGSDQSPSFAPNSQMLLFGSRAASGQIVQTVPLVGGLPIIVAAGREAAWGPYA